MAKILITGGAGYIGAVLTPSLLKEGHEITVIDNFMFNQPSLLDCVNNKKLTVIRGDARDENIIKKHIKDVEYIFPMAAIVGAPLCDRHPHDATTTNLDGVKTILKLRDKSQKIIYPTTNSGYGIGEEGVYCDETTPLRPISLYGRTKVEAEKALLESGNVITLRLATVFGVSPRMRLDLLVNDFTYRAVYDQFLVLFESHFKRNYIHVRDITKAFVHVMKNFETMKNEPYNVGLSDANLSKWELCEKIKEQVPGFIFVESKVGEDPDKRNYIVSNEKIEKTGFKPDMSLEEGIAELVKGYQIIKRTEFSNT